MSNIDAMRSVTVSGASAKNRATTTGSSAVSRRSFSIRMRPTASRTPTSALRENVSGSATTSAGITSAGQSRSRDPKTSRATAAQVTSITRPEYVM